MRYLCSLLLEAPGASSQRPQGNAGSGQAHLACGTMQSPSVSGAELWSEDCTSLLIFLAEASASGDGVCAGGRGGYHPVASMPHALNPNEIEFEITGGRGRIPPKSRHAARRGVRAASRR